MSVCCGSEWWWFDVQVVEEREGLLPGFFVCIPVCVCDKFEVGFGSLNEVAGVGVFVKCI